MIKNSDSKLYIKSVNTNLVLVTFSEVVDNGETALLAIDEDQISSTPHVLIVWHTESIENGGYIFAPFDNGARSIAISHGKKNGVVGCDTEAEDIKMIFFTFEKVGINQFHIKSDNKYLSIDENGDIYLSNSRHLWHL